jgi:thermitase
VTPPAGTPGGTYNLTVGTWDPTLTTHAGEAPATFVVLGDVTDVTPPEAGISSPTEGSRIPKNGRVKIEGSASDNKGVAKIEVSIDGQSVASDSTSSISFIWNARSAAAGAHKVTVKAYDAAGNSSTASVTVVK